MYFFANCKINLKKIKGKKKTLIIGILSWGTERNSFFPKWEKGIKVSSFSCFRKNISVVAGIC